MKNIYFLLIVITCYSCTVFRDSSNQIILDKWYTVDVEQDQIMFKSDGSFIFIPPSFDKSGIDTLSFGTWKIDNNFIEINSDSTLFKKYYDLEVNESFTGSKDSIYIIVNNEQNDFIDINDVYSYPFVNYITSLEFKDGYAYLSGVFDKKITLKRSTISNLKKISIDMYPNLVAPFTSRNNVKTTPTALYYIKDNENNTFDIRVIDFDEQHFAYKLFKSEYIKIINKDTLLWDGVKCYRRNVKK